MRSNPCLKYLNAFTMISFPVKIQFDSDLQSFKVSGNYEWEYNGKRFLRI